MAGRKTMQLLKEFNLYKKMRSDGKRLMNIFKKALNQSGVEYKIVGDETLFDVIFYGKKVENYRDYISADVKLYTKFNKVFERRWFSNLQGKYMFQLY